MEGKVIYPTSDEKLVNAVVLFAGTEGGLFYDEALLKPVSTDEALNLFKKGLILVSVDGGFKRPTGITVTEGGYTIVYGEGGGSEATKVVEIELEFGEGDPTFTATVDGTEVHYEEVKDLYLGGNCKFVVSLEEFGLQLEAFQPVLDESNENIAVFGIMPSPEGTAVTIINVVITESSESDMVRQYSMTVAG